MIIVIYLTVTANNDVVSLQDSKWVYNFLPAADAVYVHLFHPVDITGGRV